MSKTNLTAPVVTTPMELSSILRAMKIKADVVGMNQYTSQTIYDLKLDPTCKVAKIRSNVEEIALQMKSVSNPIAYAVPKEGLVKLEVPTGMRDDVQLRRDDTYPSEGLLPMFLGRKSNGQAVEIDVAQSVNLLISGASGSGKSIALHVIIGNALRLGAELYLSDPKQVELNAYKNISQCKVYTDNFNGTKEMLEELIEKMEFRYQVFAAQGQQHITKGGMFLPVVVVIDEVADLIQMDDKKVLEGLIGRLSSKGRAAGIHIVLSTQRPSVGVVSGLIKANFPTRLCCKVANRIDSQVVLDAPGAQDLLGKGDAILNCYNHSFTRLQIAYTSTFENLKYNK